MLREEEAGAGASLSDLMLMVLIAMDDLHQLSI